MRERERERKREKEREKKRKKWVGGAYQGCHSSNAELRQPGALETGSKKGERSTRAHPPQHTTHPRLDRGGCPRDASIRTRAHAFRESRGCAQNRSHLGRWMRRERQRDRETDRDRQRQIGRERQTDRQRETEGEGG